MPYGLNTFRKNAFFRPHSECDLIGFGNKPFNSDNSWLNFRACARKISPRPNKLMDVGRYKSITVEVSEVLLSASTSYDQWSVPGGCGWRRNRTTTRLQHRTMGDHTRRLAVCGPTDAMNECILVVTVNAQQGRRTSLRPVATRTTDINAVSLCAPDCNLRDNDRKHC